MGCIQDSTDNIAALLKSEGLNILSVHAKRDIGIYLCSEKAADIDEGIKLMCETLFFAVEIGSPVCVFHLWDTWKEDFNIRMLNEIFTGISLKYPGIKSCVENVPTHLKGYTPYDLARQFKWITLDLQWANLYNELESYEEIKDSIVNVHLRGQLDNSRWTIKNSPLGFYEILNKIIGAWGYIGTLTMEPHGLKTGDLHELIQAMSSLKTG